MSQEDTLAYSTSRPWLQVRRRRLLENLRIGSVIFGRYFGTSCKVQPDNLKTSERLFLLRAFGEAVSFDRASCWP